MTLEQAQNATYKIQGGKLIITSGGHSFCFKLPRNKIY